MTLPEKLRSSRRLMSLDLAHQQKRHHLETVNGFHLNLTFLSSVIYKILEVPILKINKGICFVLQNDQTLKLSQYRVLIRQNI